MDDAAFVSRGQRVGDLSRDVDSLIERERSLPQPILERLSFHQLHDDAGGVSDLLEPVNLGDVGVVQRGQDLRLAFKPRQPIGIVREMVRQQLQGDVALQSRIAAPKDDSHAAFAQLGGDLVRTNAGAGRQWP